MSLKKNKEKNPMDTTHVHSTIYDLPLTPEWISVVHHKYDGTG